MLFRSNEGYRYRKYLAKEVALIDPSYETAKEAYIALRAMQLEQENSQKTSNAFFITIPNKSLAEVQLQEDGWFTYQYKYGRQAGEAKKYVRYVPFDKINISAATYKRIQLALPNVFTKINLQVK